MDTYEAPTARALTLPKIVPPQQAAYPGWIRFAGRRGEHDPIHDAIAALKPGDDLKISNADRGRWLLQDERSWAVGRLAKGFEPPAGMRWRSASVRAILAWSREASDPEYRDAIRSDAWEVVVPELVFEPNWLRRHATINRSARASRQRLID